MVKGRRGSYKLVNQSNKLKMDDANNDEEVDEIDRGSDISEKKKSAYAVTRFWTAGLGNLSLTPSLHTRIKEGDANNVAIPKTAILFQPHTGKTHQLRVAAKSLAMPILGDARYGGGRLDISTSEISDDDGAFDVWSRTYLHAAAIHFQLENENVTIWSPPPFDHLFSTTELNDIFVGMMEKHCEGSPILDAIRSADATTETKRGPDG